MATRRLTFKIDGYATKYQSTLGKVAASTKRGLATMAKIGIAGGAAISAAWIAALRKTAEFGDTIDKTSKRTNISVAELQRLAFAAELSDTSIEGLEKTVKRMQVSIIDLQRGTKEAVDNFDALGMSAADLENLSTEDQLLKIMEALAGIDENARGGLAQKILGRGGTALLPMLTEGADGLRQLRAEREALGPLMTAGQVANAAAFNDALSRLKSTAQSAIFQGLADAMPTLTKALNELAASGSFERLTPALQALSGAMAGIIEQLIAFAGKEENMTGIVSVIESITAVAQVALTVVEKLVAAYGKMQAFVGNKAEALVGAAGDAQERIRASNGFVSQQSTSDIILNKMLDLLNFRLPQPEGP